MKIKKSLKYKKMLNCFDNWCEINNFGRKKEANALHRDMGPRVVKAVPKQGALGCNVVAKFGPTL